MLPHLVRTGALGEVGRFTAPAGQRFARGARVVCRTPRGLEVGEVLAPLEGAGAASADGELLRDLTPEDAARWAEQQARGRSVLDALTLRLVQEGSATLILDAELLFDGARLCVYFLGDASEPAVIAAEELAAELHTELELLALTQVSPEAAREDAGGGCGSGGCGSGGCGSGGCGSGGCGSGGCAAPAGDPAAASGLAPKKKGCATCDLLEVCKGVKRKKAG